MNVLAIDTSNQALGVAIGRDDEVVAEYQTNIKRNHSVQLMPAIVRLMEEAEMTPQDLDRIAVAHGPGSFTGVRIGLTTAKTLAWSLSIPIVAVSSLEVLAYNGVLFDGYVCPFFDARRGLVYTGLYAYQNGNMQRVEDDVNMAMEGWLDHLSKYDKPIVFVSNDLAVHQTLIQAKLGGKSVMPEVPVHLPRAAMLAQLATKKEPTPVHELTPHYLRLAEAEAKWLAQQEQQGHE
ncbi:tRNA (adenosine(37)-N6)-threonylcarbamoyltransferase complex dimerization subunit type 1 TsaB [Pontibacillus litoralis]|uniref:Gcp-like domain-containing protein n=1 Tax=Pontibacillus litoralis JSM 072002 TaxID=1385512 RepID=A0A0A5G1Y2_9BACI|nr:tRNA (adenosine(37)-N6)-threonylcarbamoyltransferase complex dimerization subunit type 1 TsaB [Pontibacillus litoralis]KGX85075.1 hypothetical protein N784_11305 [Pontibacillus litoralis JSM 072002]